MSTERSGNRKASSPGTEQMENEWKEREGRAGEKGAGPAFCSAYQIQTGAGNENWCRSE